MKKYKVIETHTTCFEETIEAESEQEAIKHQIWCDADSYTSKGSRTMREVILIPEPAEAEGKK